MVILVLALGAVIGAYATMRQQGADRASQARKEAAEIWDPQTRFKIMFEIEAHATQKLGELGVVPPSGAKALWDWWATNPAIDVAAIDAIEAVTKHDVIAFLDWVAQQVGPEARFMQQGMTSSDVLDTTLAVQLVRALALAIGHVLTSFDDGQIGL